MNNNALMNHQERFEDEGFVYELTVQSSEDERIDLRTASQPGGYFCQWAIKAKNENLIRHVKVTDDDCELIVFTSVEAAVNGAKDFLSI